MAYEVLAAFVFAFLGLAAECEAHVGNPNPPAIICYLLGPAWIERDYVLPPINGFSAEELNDPSYCTHIFFPATAFGNQLFHTSPDDIDRDDAEKRREEYFRKGQEMRRQKPGLKLLLSIAASTRLIGTPMENQKFVNHTIQYLVENQMDGLHLEFIQAGTLLQLRDGGMQLISELCEEYEKRNLDLSISIPNTSPHTLDLMKTAPIQKCLDFIIIESENQSPITYGSTAILNPVFNESAEIAWFEEQGIPRSKLVVMFPLSALTFKLKDPQDTSVGAPIDGPGLDSVIPGSGYIPVTEMFKRLNNSEEGWVVRRDASSYTPYAVSADGIWSTYEDFQSITAKTRYIKDLGLGGIAVLSMELDDWRGELGHGHYPYIRAIHDALDPSQ